MWRSPSKMAHSASWQGSTPNYMSMASIPVISPSPRAPLSYQWFASPSPIPEILGHDHFEPYTYETPNPTLTPTLTLDPLTPDRSQEHAAIPL